MREVKGIDELYMCYRSLVRQGREKTAKKMWSFIKKQEQLIREKKINEILND